MNRELKIGIVVMLAFAALYFGGTFLSGSNPFKTDNNYHAYYKDVNGLLIANEVRFQGFKVGRVNDITFDGEKGKWLVTFSVDEKSLVLMDSSVAAVGSADILGTMILNLQDIDKGQEVLPVGAFMISNVEKGLQEAVDDRIKPLVVKIEGLIGSVDSVINVVTLLLDERTIGNIHKSMEKIPIAMNHLLSITKSADSITTSIKDARVGDLIANINSIAGNLRRNNKTLTGVFENLNSITDSIAKSNIKETFNHLNNVLSHVDSISTDIQNGRGSLGLLLKDDKLYNDLAYTAADLDLLLLDLRENPKRYFHFSLFGKKNKEKEVIERDTAEYNRMFPPVVRQMVKFELDSALRMEIKEMLKEERGK